MPGPGVAPSQELLGEAHGMTLFARQAGLGVNPRPWLSASPAPELHREPLQQPLSQQGGDGFGDQRDQGQHTLERSEPLTV
uniref:Uncharacterized protein n=1 Tax=mine drainage metagenome TaxID=410659 RepID=E6PMT5_9ZZZZ